MNVDQHRGVVLGALHLKLDQNDDVMVWTITYLHRVKRRDRQPRVHANKVRDGTRREEEQGDWQQQPAVRHNVSKHL